MRVLFSILLFSSFLVQTLAQSEEIWGVTENGGIHNGGTILRLNRHNASFIKEHDFYRTDVKSPGKSLLKASNGLIYGISDDGLGNIFTYDPNDGSLQVVYRFEYDTAYSPNYGLIEANNGKIYGTTKNNGRYGEGVLFEFDPMTNQLKVLYEFLENSYTTNDGRLMQASNGSLYGITTRGSNGRGYIFEYNIATGLFYKRHQFVQGFDANGHLIEGNNGKLYGFTQGGGADNQGIMFEYGLNNQSFQILLDFKNSLGSRPRFSPVLASDGKIYGIADYIFSYDPTNGSFDFITNTGPVGYATGGLVEGPGNNLYFAADDNRGGSIAAFNLNSRLLSKAYDFNPNYQQGADNGPKHDFIFLNATTLLGICNSGSCGYNTLFQYNFNDTTFSSLHQLFCGYDGAIPTGKIVQASNSKFYTATSFGGNHLRGAIVEFDANTGKNRTILHIPDSMGSQIIGNLFEYKPNHLLLVTKNLGGSNDGKLYAFNVNSQQLKLLYDYNGDIFDPFSKEEFAPEGEFTRSADGKVYGFASERRVTVTMIDPSNDQVVVETPNHNLSNYFLKGGFVEVGSKMYGSSSFGGRGSGSSSLGSGTILEFSKSNQGFRTVLHLQSYGISSANSNLIQSKGSNLLYGTFSAGSTYARGGFFAFDPSKDSIVEITELQSDVLGSYPVGDIVQAQNGLIYSFCAEGGSFGNGSIVAYDPTTQLITKENDLGSNYGSFSPYNIIKGGLILASVCALPSTPKLNASQSFYCTKDSIEISIDSNSRLFDATQWNLYYNDDFLQSNQSGRFKTKAQLSGTYQVKGAGGCITNSTAGELYINVYPKLKIENCDPEFKSEAENGIYQWIKVSEDENITIIDANDKAFTAAENGNYAVEVTQNGCTDTSKVFTSINAEIVGNTFQDIILFGPNPTQNFMQINLRKCYPSTTIKIVDHSGAIIKETTQIERHNIQVLDNLPQGLYFIHIKTNTGEEATIKAMKH